MLCLFGNYSSLCADEPHNTARCLKAALAPEKGGDPRQWGGSPEALAVLCTGAHLRNFY